MNQLAISSSLKTWANKGNRFVTDHNYITKQSLATYFFISHAMLCIAGAHSLGIFKFLLSYKYKNKVGILPSVHGSPRAYASKSSKSVFRASTECFCLKHSIGCPCISCQAPRRHSPNPRGYCLDTQEVI